MKNGHPFKITEVWAFVTIDQKNGEEGIPAITGPEGLVMPMVCADKARVSSMLPFAEAISKARGCKIKLVRFHAMEIIAENILETKVKL